MKFPCWIYNFDSKELWEECKKNNPDCSGRNRVCEEIPPETIIVTNSYIGYSDSIDSISLMLENRWNKTIRKEL